MGQRRQSKANTADAASATAADGVTQRPDVLRIRRILGEAVVTSATIDAWFESPKPYLDGATPYEWLERGGDAERVVAGAEQTAARLAS